MNGTRPPPREVETPSTSVRSTPDSIENDLEHSINHMTRRLIMSKVSVSGLMVLCAAVAACADTSTTAPDVRPSLSEASADVGASYTLDGPFDVAFAGDDASAQLAGAQVLGAQLAASTQAASGSRATGHVGFPSGWPNSGIAAEKYSFAAVGTDPVTLAAKGQFEVAYTTGAPLPAGDVRIHGEVVCMIVFGNTSRVVGQITKIWRNGVPSPITANTHAFWVVVDNGEGAANPDWVSLVRFSNATIAQNYCVNGFLSFVSPNQEGNVQVQP